MNAYIKFQDKSKIFIYGIWDKNTIYEDIKIDIKNDCVFDFSNLEYIDSVGVRFFLALESDLKNKNIKINRKNLKDNFNNLFILCERNYVSVDYKEEKKSLNLKDYFSSLGFDVFCNIKILKRFISFVGMLFLSIFSSFIHPKKIRFISLLYHIENSIVKAMPIIALTSLLVGVVLAYQASYQLRQFGANIFIVDLMGISATRELAPLISAIVIAGRSASSYTAQIGVMKLTDEISAMNTMGFKSSEFIILPRVLALVIAMPLIVALADTISVLGGMIVAKFSLDINFSEFLTRFKEAVGLKHILIGLFKAPVFGFLIGTIACFRGFEVQNTTSSIGIFTTKSVVNAIFWVIAFDALFSIILTKMGV